MDIIPQKTCNACHQSFPLTSDHWHKNKRIKDGFARECKVCAKARAKDWYYENIERSKQSAKQWRIDHPEEYHVHNLKSAQKRREYSPEQKAELKRKDAEYRKRANEQRRDYNREYRRIHPEWAIRVCNDWRKNNPVRSSINNRIAAHRRRARLLAAGGTFTAADIRLQYRSQRGKCWHCGKPVGDDYHVDHLRPLAKDGSNDPRNLVISCAPCNLSKGDKQTWEWNRRLL